MKALARANSSLKAYLQPRTLFMLALGFSSGLPFLLTGNTLGYWLRDKGSSLSAIGFISLVGLAYSLKFLWAPLIERLDAPLLGRLGRRRGWMALAQLIVAAGLLAMALTGPQAGLALMASFALLVAFASATQDIVVDAWRIESAQSGEELGLLTSAYQIGYRIALLAADALILIVAAQVDWPISYGLYAALMAVGFTATLLAGEPQQGDAALARIESQTPLSSARGIFDAIIGPFVVFFRTHGVIAFLMLAAISLYRVPDFVMGPMANPFYHDIGLTKSVVGAVRGTVGLVAALAGVAVGGFCVLRLGMMRALLLGGLLQGFAVAAFALLARQTPNLELFSAIMAADNFGTSFAGVALIAYMSSLTSQGYTATQYALLTSAYAWVGKLLKAPSGAFVQMLSQGHGLLGGYALFFLCAGLAGLPALLLFLVLMRADRKLAGISAATP